MRNQLKFFATTLAVSGLTLVGLVPSLPASAGARANTVDIQVLNVSDFHGQLDPLSVCHHRKRGGQ